MISPADDTVRRQHTGRKYRRIGMPPTQQPGGAWRCMCIGNGLQSWLWVVPDAWSQGSRRRVHRRARADHSCRQHDAWPRRGRWCSAATAPSWQQCAAVPVIQARLASARAQFLCHRALRAAMAQPWRACCSRGRGPSQVWGQAKTARARHAPPAPAQARSQNDGYTALILRAGSQRAGVPHPRAACHRRVQRVAGADVQPLPSVRSGRGDARLCAGDGGRNGAGGPPWALTRSGGRAAIPTRRPVSH